MPEESGFPATSAGAVMAGGVVSTVVTFCRAVAVSPRLSLTVQITVVMPTGNRAGALLVIVGFGSAGSVTVGWPMSPRYPPVVLASLVTSCGAVVVGSTFTVTVCVAAAALPEASVAVQVTVVAPKGKTAGASLVIVGLGS